MPRVNVTVELDAQRYRAYEHEARRRGVSVEKLVEMTLVGLLDELDCEESEGTDHPIIPS